MVAGDGSSQYCCPGCRAWSRDCGVGYCRNESLSQRAYRKAAQASAIRFQTFIDRLPGKKVES